MKRFKQFFHTSWDVFKLYWEIAPGLTLGILFTQVILQLQGIVTAYIFGLFIDQAIRIITVTSDLKQIIPLVALLGGSFLIFDIVSNLNNYFNGILSSIDTFKIKLRQTDFMVKLGISQMEDPELTNISTRFSEVYGSMNQHLTLLVNLISSIVSTIAYGIAVLSFAPIVVLLITFFFLIKFLNNGRFIKRIWKLSLEYTEERRNAWTSISFLGDPGALKELLISDGTGLLRNKFTKFVDWYNHEYRKIRNRWAIFENLQVIGDAIIFTFGILLLLEKAIQKVITIGGITFYLRSLGSFSDQMSSLSYGISRAIDSSIRLKDALDLFEIYKPERDGAKILSSQKEPPTIKVTNLTFKYPNGKNPVIKNLNLTFKSGEKVAIVGENGAGKTTLVKLLTRIYRPQEGEITLNDININELTKESLYNKFGVLFQDFNTYSNLTVAENVHIGKTQEKLDKELLEKSLDKADAMNFVKDYPKFIDQILSERYKGGIRPSGGQWQKIAISRLFYRNAPILILDEPTASIDAVSEAKIFDNVYRFMKGKTVIIISHRFSTVRNADRILVLDKGQIIEEGTHKELMKLNGKYAHAFNLQAKGYQ